MSPTWSEKGNVYVMMLAPPGIGKTPTSEIFHGPLQEIEQEENEELADNEGDAGKQRKLRTLEQV